MAKRTNRVAWGLAAVLGVLLLGGVVALGVRLKPYWIAKYRGFSADLRGVVLVHAPLQEAILEEADLSGADLRGADLRKAYLGGANLAGTDLRGADLRVSSWWEVSWGDGRIVPQTTTDLTGARYDAQTRWPAGFDPRKHGAIPVK
jgi:uncharacterized protein YjbI with pentapeptide repeats